MADAVGFAKGRAKEAWQNMASLFLCHADHTWPACFPCHAANANWPSRGKWHIRRARSLTTDDITILWKLGLWFGGRGGAQRCGRGDLQKCDYSI